MTTIKEYQSYMAQFRNRCYGTTWHYRYVRKSYLDKIAELRKATR